MASLFFCRLRLSLDSLLQLKACPYLNLFFMQVQPQNDTPPEFQVED